MKPTLRTATLLSLALLAGLSLLTPISARAQINYQGRLTDPTGAPLPDGQYTLTFSLWDAATGGTKIWGDYIADGGGATGHGSLADLVDSRFNVIIGGTDTASRSLTTALAVSATRYLEIKVGSNAAISPRQIILASPRALSADVIPNVTPNGAGNTTITGNANITGTVTVTGNLVSGFVHTNGAQILKTEVDFSNGSAYFGNQGNHTLGLKTSNLVRLAIGGGGDVGIGTSGPGAKLDVRGDIKLGSTGQYFAASGEENLRIVRGTVSATGTKLAGAGFTSARTSGGGSGDYTITFSTGFSAAPAVTGASMTGQGVFTIYGATGVTTTTVRVVMYETTAFNNLVDYQFNFIAVGPR